MIASHHFERAEQKLSNIYKLGVGPETSLRMQADMSDMDPDAINQLIAHHMEALRQRLPDLVRDEEPKLATMLRHFLLVGVLARDLRGDV